ncbi:MAG: HAD family hydrolase [Planctomycetota bacterium]
MYEIERQKDFLVGIDSDGCVFDSMELKHKECFIPNIVKFYDLQCVSKFAREAAEFVNLYSRSRGTNRFPALIQTLEWLQNRPEVVARGVAITVPESLREWTNRESRLGNPSLKAEVERTSDPDLSRALQWSLQVNEDIAAMVSGLKPFPLVRECLDNLSEHADQLVVSATPNEALVCEWNEHDLAKYVVEICGQESGSKKETLKNADKYPANQTLMIGDAPGDFRAATENRCLFFPINPGAEEDSWQRLFEDGIDRFLGGTFAGDYQQSLLEEFEQYLPESPPWQPAA